MVEVTEPRVDSFPLLLFLSHRLEYIADSELKKDDLTTKQYLTVAVIENLYDHSPSISELAQSLSTTHQNIKQIALQLQKKGFIKIERDESDKRTWRLKVTEKNKAYWNSRAKEHEAIVRSFFASLSDSEIQTFSTLLLKLIMGTNETYRKFREKQEAPQTKGLYSFWKPTRLSRDEEEGTKSCGWNHSKHEDLSSKETNKTSGAQKNE
jgi:DNA-binding MarR family transcriptional regulator